MEDFFWKAIKDVKSKIHFYLDMQSYISLHSTIFKPMLSLPSLTSNWVPKLRRRHFPPFHFPFFSHARARLQKSRQKGLASAYVCQKKKNSHELGDKMKSSPLLIPLLFRTLFFRMEPTTLQSHSVVMCYHVCQRIFSSRWRKIYLLRIIYS